MSVRVTDKDNGYKKMRANLKRASKGGGVSVGIHAQEGAQQHEGEPATVLDVAIWNEFGLGVPERSFIRAWVDENASENREKLRKAMAMVVRGQKTLEQALELIGLSFQGGVQKKIAAGVPPPNAPETVARKGSSTPLINKGQMRQSVTYLVRDKPPSG